MASYNELQMDALGNIEDERSFSNLQAVIVCSSDMADAVGDDPLMQLQQLPAYGGDCGLWVGGGLTETPRRWSRTPPVQWTCDDVLDWIYYHVIHKAGIDQKNFEGENFQRLTGRQLCSMSRTEFVQLNRDYGDALFDSLQELRGGYWAETAASVMSCLSDIDYLTDLFLIDGTNLEDDLERGLSQLSDADTDMAADTAGSPLPSISSFMDPPNATALVPSNHPHRLPLFDLEFDNAPLTFDCSDMRDSGIDRLPENESGYDSGDSSPLGCDDARYNCSMVDITNSSNVNISVTSQRRSLLLPPSPTVDKAQLAACCVAMQQPPSTVPRRPGRPRKVRQNSESSSSSSSSSSPLSASWSDTAAAPAADDNSLSQLPPYFRRRRENKSKTPHLWKFMRALLENAAYNPDYIRWENKDEGVFRIVPGQSKHIAVLWGRKKNNPTMTFDKLSRSLRWCRTYGFLSEVPKNGRYPKKLCFRFASHAMKWEPDQNCLM